MENNHPFLKRGKSAIDGVGIFTRKHINKSEIFYLIPLDHILNSPAPRLARVGENQYINDDIVLNWINHSCNPNAILDISTDQPYLIAKLEIKSGEEIVCDYNRTEKNGAKVVCNCKSPNCKGYFLRIE